MASLSNLFLYVGHFQIQYYILAWYWPDILYLYQYTPNHNIRHFNHMPICQVKRRFHLDVVVQTESFF